MLSFRDDKTAMTTKNAHNLPPILYRDDALIVLDKPAGLPVHKGPKGGETLDDYLDPLRFGLPTRPAIGHRLDKDTSGCLALGRTQAAIRRLSALFARHLVGKDYCAILCGAPFRSEGEIDVPIGRLSDDPRSWWMKVDPIDGRPAVTRYRVLARAADDCAALVLLSPQTGRTHQLRVHMAHLGTPIAGDGIYGGAHALKLAPRLCLHACRLILPFYPNQAAIEVSAPLPAAWETLLDHLFPGGFALTC